MSPDLRDRLALLLTELVNNAIQHGGADERRQIEVRLSWPSQCLRVEVRDPGRNGHGSAERITTEGGWGLILVDHLADRWGRDTHPTGGSIAWFELVLEGRLN